MDIKIDNTNKKIFFTDLANVFYKVNSFILDMRYISVVKINNIVYDTTNIETLETNRDLFDFDEEYLLTGIKVDINKIQYLRGKNYITIYNNNQQKLSRQNFIVNLKHGKFHNREDIAVHLGMAYYFFINGKEYDKEHWLKEYKKYNTQKDRIFKIKNKILS